MPWRCSTLMGRVLTIFNPLHCKQNDNKRPAKVGLFCALVTCYLPNFSRYIIFVSALARVAVGVPRFVTSLPKISFLRLYIYT